MDDVLRTAERNFRQDRTPENRAVLYRELGRAGRRPPLPTPPPAPELETPFDAASPALGPVHWIEQAGRVLTERLDEGLVALRYVAEGRLALAVLRLDAAWWSDAEEEGAFEYSQWQQIRDAMLRPVCVGWSVRGLEEDLYLDREEIPPDLLDLLGDLDDVLRSDLPT